MKIKSLLKVLLIISLPLILTACSSSSFFNSGTDVTASATDISRAYLTQIFGSVQGALIGNGQQVIGRMFGQFNLAVLSLVGIMLCYSIFSTALRCANEGSFQVNGKSVVYTFIKVIVGIALVVPSTSTGYCMAQEIVMKTVMASISAADALWDECLDYIGSGHSLFDDPNDSANPTLYDILVGPSDGTPGEAYNNFMGNYTTIESSPAKLFYDESNLTLGLFVLAAESCMISQGIAPVSGVDGDNVYQFPLITSSGSAGQCGKIDLSQASFLDSSSDDYPLYMNDLTNAVSAVSQDMLPGANVLACAQSDKYRANNPSLCDSYSDVTLLQQSFFNADIDYTTNILPIYDAITTSGEKAGDINTDLQQYGKADGWLGAGRYSWVLTKTKAEMLSMKNFGTYNLTGTGVFTALPNTEFWKDPQSVEVWQRLQYAYDDSVNGSSASTSSILGYAAAATGTEEAANSSGKNNDADNVFLDIVTMGIDSVYDLFGGTSAYSDPRAFLLEVGAKCLSAASTIWLVTMVLIIATGALAYAFSAWQGAGFVFEMVFSWITPIMLAVMAMLISSGVILAYYVPMYPYIVFTFAAVAWFIAVVEAMVAAPLIAYGMSNPDGHELQGKAEHGIMLLIGIFLRPSLMILGLILGLILSFVTFRFVNYSFCQFLSDLYTNHYSGEHAGNLLYGVSDVYGNMKSNDLISNIITKPILLVIFSGIVIEAMNFSFSLIYILPDYVLKWIGGPQSTSIGNLEQHIGAVKSAVAGVGKATSDGLSKAAEGAGAGFSSAIKDRQGHEDKGDPTKVEV